MAGKAADGQGTAGAVAYIVDTAFHAAVHPRFGDIYEDSTTPDADDADAAAAAAGAAAGGGGGGDGGELDESAHALGGAEEVELTWSEGTRCLRSTIRFHIIGNLEAMRG
eukprot:COSAG05_NODE_2578_length_2878_cov_1.755308_4_plen_110_part_00